MIVGNPIYSIVILMDMLGEAYQFTARLKTLGGQMLRWENPRAFGLKGRHLASQNLRLDAALGHICRPPKERRQIIIR